MKRDEWYQTHDRLIDRPLSANKWQAEIDRIDLAWDNTELACPLRGWNSQAAIEHYAVVCCAVGRNN